MTRSVFVTGATGLIGHAITKALAARGDRVRALVRDVGRARSVLPAEVELVQGDITEPRELPEVMKGSELVFHAAGMPEQWQRDEAIFDRVNRGGTKNVLEASLQAQVRRVVYTSTMDVFAAPPGGTLREDSVDPSPKPTAYERSKQAAEREAEACERRGLEIVYVNPGAVYGTGIASTLNGFLLRLLRGQIPLLPPGGMPIAYIDGVVQSHIAAADLGRPGQRYLVADAHLSMRDIAARALSAAGGSRRVPSTAPAWLLRKVTDLSAPLARTLGFTPLIAPGELSFLLWDVRIDSSKAERELGFRPTPANIGIPKAVEALLGDS